MGVYIWGAGKFGKSLIAYLKRKKFNILGTIDNNSGINICEGIKVVSFEDIDDYSSVFIAVYKKRKNESIVKQITNSGKR